MNNTTIIYGESVSDFFYILNNSNKELWWEYGDSLASEEEISKKFEDLKREWLADTSMLSSPRLKYDNENYKEIIKLDSFVLPSIIEDLRENNNDWLFALRTITGIDPVPKEHQGDFELMKEDWLSWAEKNMLQQYASNDFSYASYADAPLSQAV